MSINWYKFVLLVLISTAFTSIILDTLYGVAYYIIPSIMYLTSFIIYMTRWYTGRYYREEIYTSIIAVSFLFIPAWFTAGLFFELGLNIDVVNGFNYMLKIIYVVSYVLGMETLRRILIDSNVFKNMMIHNIILTGIITILYMNLFESFSLTIDNISMYIILFGYNYVATIISRINGFKNQINYIIPIFTMLLLSPLQPVLNTLMKRLVLGLILVAQTTLLVIIHYHEKIQWYRFKPIGRRYLVKNIFEYSMLIFTLTLMITYIIGYRPLVVISGSMTPSIRIGDIVIVDTRDKDPDINDTMVFLAEGKVIVHRVVYKYVKNSKEYYITKGDANKEIDPWVISRREIIGKTVLVIPYVGKPTLVMREVLGEPIRYSSIAISLLLVLLIIYMFKESVYT